MGNESSEFESQFAGLFSFIEVVQDPLLGCCKVYRKRKFAFDYMLVAETPLVPGESAMGIQQKLALIRRHQNESTVQLQFSKMLEEKACEVPMLRLYVDYYNHTLFDYLNALRGNNLHLSLDEIKFVVRSLAEAIVVIRKMKIDPHPITPQNIYISADQGRVALSPVHLLYQRLSKTYHCRDVSVLAQDYKPLGHSQTHLPTHDSVTLDCIRKVVLEMTRYLRKTQLNASSQFYKGMLALRSVHQISHTVECRCEQLNVEQFGETASEQGDLYDKQDYA